MPDKAQNCDYCAILEENTLQIAKTTDWQVALAQPAYNAGHLWLIDIKHGRQFIELPDEAQTSLLSLTNRCIKVLTKVCQPAGIDVGFSQKLVPENQHFCLEIVPRWQGDANFTFTGGQIKAIGIDIPTLFEQLKEAFDEQ